MYRLELKKPDGRQLTLYSRTPIAGVESAPSPRKEPVHPNPHLRWHPLRGEWVTYASHRQDRTFLPPPEYNPLRPTTDPANPTELPSGNYDVKAEAPGFATSAVKAVEVGVDQVRTLDLVLRVGAKAVCATCHARWAPVARLCAQCGAPAAAAPQAALSPKFCASCGTKLDGGARFCPGCGSAVK